MVGVWAMRVRDKWIECPCLINIPKMLTFIKDKHLNGISVIDETDGGATVYYYGLEWMAFVPVSPSPTNHVIPEVEITEGGKVYKTAEEIEKWLEGKTFLKEAIVYGDLTVRQVAQIVGGSTATTGRVIKKMRGN